MVKQILIFLSLLCVIVNCFQPINKVANINVSRTRPSTGLQTASTGLLSHIPRLEVGIRALFRSRGDSTYEYEIPAFMMDWQLPNQDKRKVSIKSIIPTIKSVTSKIFSYFKQVIATASIIASSLLSTSIKSTIAFGSATISTVSLVPSIRKYSKLSSTQKLGTTPLFYLANSGGNPYLQEDVQAGRPEQRIITYFMSSDDANEYLNEIAQGNPANLNEFRIFTTTMEKVVNRIENRKQSRKLGRYNLSTVLRIQPSSRQVQNAELIAGRGNEAKGANALQGVSVPMFCAEGLILKRSSGEVFVPYYFCYEDLVDDWNKLKKETTATSTSATITTEKKSIPKVMIKDFREVMCLSQGISKSFLNNLNGKDESKATSTTIADQKTNKVGSVKVTKATSTASSSTSELTRKQIEEALMSSAIMPPRREIEMLRQFYRSSDAGISKEFQKSRLIGGR